MIGLPSGENLFMISDFILEEDNNNFSVVIIDILLNNRDYEVCNRPDFLKNIENFYVDEIKCISISVSAKEFSVSFVKGAEQLSKKYSKPTLINVYYPLLNKVDYGMLDVDNSISYFNIFNLHPDYLYDDNSHRNLEFYNQHLSCYKKNNYVKSAILYITSVFIKKRVDMPVNCTSVLFGYKQEITSIINIPYELPLLNNRGGDLSSISLISDLCRFFRNLYGIDILKILNLNVDIVSKINNHIELIDFDIRSHKTAKNWYKGKALTAFGVEIGECLEYFVMEDLVIGDSQ